MSVPPTELKGIQIVYNDHVDIEDVMANMDSRKFRRNFQTWVDSEVAAGNIKYNRPGDLRQGLQVDYEKTQRFPHQ